MKIIIEITPRPQLIAFLGSREAAENLIYQDICEVLLPNLQKPMLIQDFYNEEGGRLMFGKVHWFCPNCGAKHYNNKLATSVKSQAAQCSEKCMNEWELKVVRYIMGKDEEELNVSK